MSKRVLIKPAIPAVYLELDEGEEVCQPCHGTGEVRWLLTSRGFESTSGWRSCGNCGGEGKVRRCVKCGKIISQVAKGFIQPGIDEWCGGCEVKEFHDAFFRNKNGAEAGKVQKQHGR